MRVETNTLNGAVNGYHQEMVHYLVLGHFAFGHCKPATVLAMSLVRMHKHLLVTLLAPEQVRPRLEPVINAYVLKPEEQRRFRLVYCPEVEVEAAAVGRMVEPDPVAWMEGGKARIAHFLPALEQVFKVSLSLHSSLLQLMAV